MVSIIITSNWCPTTLCVRTHRLLCERDVIFSTIHCKHGLCLIRLLIALCTLALADNYMCLQLSHMHLKHLCPMVAYHMQCLSFSVRLLLWEMVWVTMKKQLGQQDRKIQRKTIALLPSFQCSSKELGNWGFFCVCVSLYICVCIYTASCCLIHCWKGENKTWQESHFRYLGGSTKPVPFLYE